MEPLQRAAFHHCSDWAYMDLLLGTRRVSNPLHLLVSCSIFQSLDFATPCSSRSSLPCGKAAVAAMPHNTPIKLLN